MRESQRLARVRNLLRRRDERHLSSELKRCADQELITLELAEKLEFIKLLARDADPESAKQRARLLRLTPPADRRRMVSAAPQPREDVTLPHTVKWEPASEILEMEWEAPVKKDVTTDPGDPPITPNLQPFAGLNALLAAVGNGPSRPVPAVMNLRPGPGGTLGNAISRLLYIEGRVAETTGCPLVIVGADTDYDEGVCRVLREKHKRRIAAVVAIGAKPPKPALVNQVAARDAVEAGAKLARVGIVDRDGMRQIVNEAGRAGVTIEQIRVSLARK